MTLKTHKQQLSISQLARYVGVTVRAVRHYHALGLLPEPARDASGYRRYGAQAVVHLTRIKTLADAGVPLSQVDRLMNASEVHFLAAINNIKIDIAKRIKALEETRQRLDQLHTGDRMFVSDTIAEYLDSLRSLGLSEMMVEHERNTWILIAALYPAHADTWAVEKKTLIHRPEIAALYRRLDEASTWSEGDPRLYTLAKDMIELAKKFPAPEPSDAEVLKNNQQAVALIDQFGVETFPSLRRLRELVEAQINS